MFKHLRAGWLLKRVNDCQEQQYTEDGARYQQSAATSCDGLRTLERKGSTCSPKEKPNGNLTFLLAIFVDGSTQAATLAAGSVVAAARADDGRGHVLDHASS